MSLFCIPGRTFWRSTRKINRGWRCPSIKLHSTRLCRGVVLSSKMPWSRERWPTTRPSSKTIITGNGWFVSNSGARSLGATQSSNSKCKNGLKRPFTGVVRGSAHQKQKMNGSGRWISNAILLVLLHSIRRNWRVWMLGWGSWGGRRSWVSYLGDWRPIIR